MSHTRHILLTLCALCLCTALRAQYLPLWRPSQSSRLCLNLDRVFNYNLYEHTRWGGGLRFDDSGTRTVGRVSRQWLLEAEGYVAYGQRDERWKGGLSAAYTLPNRWRTRPFAYAAYDLIPAASRQLDAFHLSDFGTTAAFMTQRFAEGTRLGAGVGWQHTRRLALAVEARWSHETPLYDDATLFYLKDGWRHRDLGRGRYTEAVASASYDAGRLRAELTLGLAHDIDRAFARLIAQYDRLLTVRPFELRLFAQAGVATTGTPYSRLFDLGGSLGSLYSFGQTLLTARPGQFGGHAFALATARLAMPSPLWDLYERNLQLGTHPRPFLQLALAWSRLAGQDADGLADIDRGETLLDGTRLWPMAWRSLHRGIVEAELGVNGLLRWGVADFGVAAVWRWVPPSASYSDPSAPPLRLLFTAALAL